MDVDDPRAVRYAANMLTFNTLTVASVRLHAARSKIIWLLCYFTCRVPVPTIFILFVPPRPPLSPWEGPSLLSHIEC